MLLTCEKLCLMLIIMLTLYVPNSTNVKIHKIIFKQRSQPKYKEILSPTREFIALESGLTQYLFK